MLKNLIGSQSQPQEGDEASLTTCLNEQQQGELTQLVARSMIAMRAHLLANFDPDAPVKQDFQSTVKKETQDAKDGIDVDQDQLRAKLEDKQQKLKQQRAKELATSESIALKTAALKQFDNWRGKVIKRIADALQVKPPTEGGPGTSSKSPDSAKSTLVPDGELDEKTIDNIQPVSQAQMLDKYYPPTPSELTFLDEDTRILVVRSVLLLLLSLEHYVAPSRILLLHLVSSLKLPLPVLTEIESKLAQGLLEAAKRLSGDAETKKHAEDNQTGRKWKVGLATVAGAALVGVTGGLAAPLIAAGLGSVMGGLGLGATAAAGYLGSVAGSTILVGGLFGAYGGRMTGKMMDNYAKEVSDFAFIPVKPEHGSEKPATLKKNIAKASSDSDTATDTKDGQQDPAERRLRITITTSGWLTSAEEVTSPWHIISQANTEVFSLRFELDALLALGNSLDSIINSTAWRYAKSEVIKRTLFAELMGAASWPLGLVQIGRALDNPFSIARQRADKAGAVLADALINKAQGERPVNLIGYSLGARVIYVCLRELSRRGALDLVENAVMMGSPCPSASAEWRAVRSAVAGRVVNVFSRQDYVLAFLYRAASVQIGVAGLAPVEGVPGVENFDVSALVSGHLRYRWLVGRILTEIGYEDVDTAAVKVEDGKFRALLEREDAATVAQGAREHGVKVLEANPLGLAIPKGANDQTVESGKRISSNTAREPLQDGGRKAEQDLPTATRDLTL